MPRTIPAVYAVVLLGFVASIVPHLAVSAVPGILTTRQLTPSRMPDADRVADDARRTGDVLQQAELVRAREKTSGSVSRALLQPSAPIPP